jgi:superfamily II DNA or RNA helicase
VAALTEQLKDLFPQSLRNRGRSYFLSKRVRLVHVDPRGAVAEVRGSGRNSYDVDLNWDRGEGTLAARCTCPYYLDHGLCKHLWAALLKVGVEADPQQLPGDVTEFISQGVSAEPGEGDYDEDDGPGFDRISLEDIQRLAGEMGFEVLNEFVDARPRSRRASRQSNRKQPRKANTTPAWKRHLQPIARPLPPPDVLDAAARPRSEASRCLIDPVKSTVYGGLWLRLVHRERGGSGKLGRWKAKVVVPGWFADSFGDDDRLLQRLVEVSDQRAVSHGGYYSYRGSGQSDALLCTPASLRLLPEACARGLVAVEREDETEDDKHQPITWEDGPAWVLRVTVESDEPAKEWVVRGCLARPESGETLSLSEPALVLPGLVLLHHERLSLCGSNGCGPWVQALSANPEVRVPFADREEFLKLLHAGGALPEMVLPDPLRLERVAPVPKPLLRLRPWRVSAQDRRWLGEIAFDYEGTRVAPEEPRGVLRLSGPDRLLTRDIAEEQRRIREVLSIPGVSRHLSNAYYYVATPRGTNHVELPEKAQSKLIETLSPGGWALELDGTAVRHAGDFALGVTAGVDWFDLNGTAQFDGVAATLPELLKAVRSGESFVELSDGSRGVLPEDWRAQLQRLADFGRIEGDRLRFAGAQALLIDSLLEAKTSQVQVDAGFRDLRRRLEQVEGVEPRREPETFRGELREYQREGLGWLQFLEEFGFGGCLADDMGLGKTVQVLALLEARRSRRAAAGELHRPSLAVVPKSLVFNWLDEAGKFAPELRVAAYHGLERKGVVERLGELDLLVTTYGTLRQDVAELQGVPFDYVILDEAQAIKNPASQAAKATRVIDARRRLAMTGTPVENHLGDLWSLFEFLNPGLLGRSENFKRLTKSLREQPNALETLARGIRPYVLRRTKEQVLTELPEKTEQTLFCDLVPKQRKLYDELRDHYRQSLLGRVESTGMAKSKIHVLEALLRLRQAACHPGLVNAKLLKETSTKLDLLEEQLDELLAEGHKTLVFSQFTSFLSLLRARLDGKRLNYEYLDGKTTRRQACVERFQNDPDCRLFLISLKAGGQGLNLTAADYVFILDPWWNPAVEAQAIDRAHRLGQDKPVFAYRMIARDTVEEKILQLQSHKRELAESIITADASLMQQLTVQDLQLLLS